MKILIVLVLIATAYAALPLDDYLPPLEDASPILNADLQSLSDSSPLADDGYRYKTVKRYRLRHRRDVNELPSIDYLPPVAEVPIADIPVAEVPLQFAGVQESAVLADDGYRYKTVKRYRYRHRRDVNELPSIDYLPPVAEAPIAIEAPAPVLFSAAQESAVLADDGYRYKTVKRFRLRHRRDVNELPSIDYLPPVAEAPIAIEAPAPVLFSAAQESAVLADDGYRYKTVKRFRLRHRRDVNELPSIDYLPPVAEAPIAIEAPAPVLFSAAQESAVLADDGYRYKTVKRFRLRHRRDVNELPSIDYLPPVAEAPIAIEAPAPVLFSAAQESAVLADDGYRYKTVKRFRLRHRRDVNELPSIDYLPPVAEAPIAIEAPAPVLFSAAQESAVLADDGYRYKTVKRFRLRHRRDVNELPSIDYLPPVAEAPIAIEAPALVQTFVQAAPAPIHFAAAQESAALADDGYRYKTVKRVVFKRRF